MRQVVPAPLQPPGPALLADADLLAVLAALPAARVVGGAVRDALLGRPIADIDLATPERPAQVMAALARGGIGAVPTGLAHGTVTAMRGKRGFEVTTLRRDVATDGRHAQVAFTADWAADAARRDVTINALSMDREGAVFDYVGGIADLVAGRVRFVGDPVARLAEDALRTLRFFRFYSLYGLVGPDAGTRAALADSAGRLGRLSAERVWAELKRLLGAPEPGPALALMAALGVLAAILPEAWPDPGPIHTLPAEPVLRLAALLRPEAPNPAARLRLSAAEAELLAALRRPRAWPEADDADGVRRLLAEIPRPVLVGRGWLDGVSPALRVALASWPVPEFPLRGRDLLAAGFGPGPELGAALAAGRRWWLAQGCRPDRDSCLAACVRARG